jgi:hypothetical protein
MLFPVVPPGPGALIVRSADHEPFSRMLDFRDAARESIDVRLDLLKGTKESR